MHGFHKFLSNGIARAFTDNGIDTTIRTQCRTVFITRIVIDQPILDLSRIKYPAAVKAAADRILLELFHVIVAELVSFYIILHKTLTEVTAPKSYVSTNSTMPAACLFYHRTRRNVNFISGFSGSAPLSNGIGRDYYVNLLDIPAFLEYNIFGIMCAV